MAKPIRRTATGQFAPGGKGGPGRPKRQTEFERYDTLRDALTDDHWRTIIDVTIRRAKKGDHKALEWLGKYLLPEKAPEFVAPATTDERLADAMAGAQYDERAAILKALVPATDQAHQEVIQDGEDDNADELSEDAGTTRDGEPAAEPEPLDAAGRASDDGAPSSD